MARIRSLHPGQATDEDFVEMSRDARLFALHLRCEADDQGVFEWKPKRLKMAIFPADDDVDVSALLSELVENRQVVEFEVEGKRFGAIRNFRLWQRPKKPNATHPLPNHLQSYVGMKDGEFPTGAEPGENDGRAVPNQFHTGSENPPQRKEEGGRREEEGSASGGAEPPVSDDPKTVLFRDGLQIVVGLLGVSEKTARSSIGKWLKVCGEDPSRVLAAIRRCREINPSVPREWLEKAMFAVPPETRRQQREDEAYRRTWAGMNPGVPPPTKRTHDERGVPLTDRGYPIDNDPWAGVN